MTSRDNADKAMGKMEVTLTGMAEDIASSLEPPHRRFRPWWLLATVIVSLVVGVSTYFLVSRLAYVPEAKQVVKTAVDRACQARNEQIDAMNHKLEQLNVLFDVSLATPRDPDQQWSSEKLMRLYAEFKKPIPHVSCDVP